MPQQQTTTQGLHLGPLCTNNEWAQWSQAGQQLRESTKRRRLVVGGEQPGREQSRCQQSGQRTAGRERGGGGYSGGARGNYGGRMNLDSMFTREGLKTFDNLKYCLNYQYGYDMDHDGWERP